MRSDGLYLSDIVHASRTIAFYLRALDAEGADKKGMVVDAVLHQLMVIGEAASRISETTKKAAPEVPWPLITGFRNLLVHEYFALATERVLLIASRDVPALGSAASNLLKQVDPTLYQQLERRLNEDPPL